MQTVQQPTETPRLHDLSRSVAHMDVAELAGAGVLVAAITIAARRAPRLLITLLGILASLVALAVRLGQRSGVTDHEVCRAFPGDDIVPDPQFVTDHGITIQAPANEIWPWIVQMGYHRGGWYTSYWLDKVVWHTDNRSVDRIVPELQLLSVGDIVPDGPPGTAYWKVAILEPGRAIVYLDDAGVHVPGVTVSWTFVLEPIDEFTTRVLVRTRGTYGRSMALALLARILIAPADFVMAGQVLRGIKTRAERSRRRRVPSGSLRT